MTDNFDSRMFLRLAKFLIPAWVIVLLNVFLIASGNSNAEIKCFAVDSQSRLYVGKPSVIEVYENNVKVNSFSPQTSKGYLFTVLEDNTILLSTSVTVYSMTLDGDVIDTWRDSGSRTYNQINHNKKEFITSSGDVYALKNTLIWPQIVKNNSDIIYRIPLTSFILNTLTTLSMLCLVVFVISATVRKRCRNNT